MLSKKQSTESETVNTFINKNELLLEHLLTVFCDSVLSFVKWDINSTYIIGFL